MVGFQEVLKYGRKSGVQLADYDVVSYAAAFGSHGQRVATLDEFGTALCGALAADGPSIIDVPVDYRRNTDLAAHLHADAFQ
jgi:acetolactate synthase-1/2/3 large subunit